MTSKHFSAVAFILKARIKDPGTRRVVADSLAEYFHAQNPAFKKKLFMAACGLDY